MKKRTTIASLRTGARMAYVAKVTYPIHAHDVLNYDLVVRDPNGQYHALHAYADRKAILAECNLKG